MNAKNPITMASTKLPGASSATLIPALVGDALAELLVAACVLLLGDPTTPPWTFAGAELLPELAAADLNWSRVWPLEL
jgi:hypothetical protein